MDIIGNWVIKPIYNFTDDCEYGETKVIKGEKVFYVDKQNKLLHG